MTQQESMRPICIELSFTEDEAYAYSLFLKRVSLADYRSLSMSEQEAYFMQNAGERVRDSLKNLGFAPR